MRKKTFKQVWDGRKAATESALRDFAIAKTGVCVAFYAMLLDFGTDRKGPFVTALETALSKTDTPFAAGSIRTFLEVGEVLDSVELTAAELAVVKSLPIKSLQYARRLTDVSKRQAVLKSLVKKGRPTADAMVAAIDVAAGGRKPKKGPKVKTSAQLSDAVAVDFARVAARIVKLMSDDPAKGAGELATFAAGRVGGVTTATIVAAGVRKGYAAFLAEQAKPVAAPKKKSPAKKGGPAKTNRTPAKVG